MNIEHALKYLTNSASVEELRDFEAWLIASQNNNDEFERFAVEWEASKKRIKAFDVDSSKAWNGVSQRIKAEQTSIRKVITLKQWRTIAAISIVVLASAFFLFNQTSQNKYQQPFVVYQTNNELRTVQLPDSTVICMNKNSEIKVPKWKKNGKRLVWLKGEAFFEVSHDPKRPFLVQTKNTITRVLGTTFDVKTNEHNDIVSLVSGKVMLYLNNNSQETITLAPGEMATYIIELNKLHKTLNQNKNLLAWKTGKLEFKNAPSRLVLNTIAEHYHLMLKGETNTIENLSLTAEFDNETIEKVLSVLEMTWGINFEMNADTLCMPSN